MTEDKMETNLNDDENDPPLISKIFGPILCLLGFQNPCITIVGIGIILEI